MFFRLVYKNEWKKKSQRKKVFVEDWLSDPDLKNWVEKDKNNKANTWCFVCNKTLPLSTAGRSTLTDHANVRKHSESVKKNTKFFYLCKEIDSITSSSSAQEGNNKRWMYMYIMLMLWKQKLFGFWGLFAVDIQTVHVNSWTVLSKQCFLRVKLQKPFQWEELNQCIWINHALAPFLSLFCYLSWINQIFFYFR